mgnify:CR=1 FL=1
MDETSKKVLEFSGLSVVGVGLDDYLKLNPYLALGLGLASIIGGYYFDHDLGYDLMAFGLGFGANAVFRLI